MLGFFRLNHFEIIRQKFLKSICQENIYKVDKNRQLTFLNSFNVGGATNNIERSFFQYKCQMYLLSPIARFVWNFISIFVYIIVPTLLINSTVLKHQHKKIHDKNKKIAVFVGLNRDVIPKSLQNDFRIFNHNNNLVLLFKDIWFIFKIFKKYLFHPYFIAKNVIKIAMYRANILDFQPSAFIVTSEYSFTSSLLTDFCEENNILHINVMHGDKLFYIRDSFFKFHKCYIWDKYYKKLFISLKADRKQFITELPESFRCIPNQTIYNKKPVITYYLQNQNRKKLIKIRKTLDYLKNKYKIFIRPHPIYSDNQIIKKIFINYEIENNKKINIYNSIAKTDFVISLYSTVLLQAYICKKNIIIDDVNYSNIYKKLSDLKYIMIEKKHMPLSRFLLENSQKY